MKHGSESTRFPVGRRAAILAASLFAAIWIFGAFPGPTTEVASRIAAVENGLRSPVPVKGEPGMNILDRMKFYNVPGVSVAVISNYRIDWAKGYGVMDTQTKKPVTEKTLFVAGSVSKPVAAMGTLRLVDEGKLSLDANINDYLKSWKLPDNEFTKTEKATLRRIMSHSAGITVHGFRGYAPGERLPDIRQILDGEPPANSAPIRVDMEPGKQWRYSGGGVTIMQQALADVEGKPFPEILREKVLAPLGMTSSSYEQTFTRERLKLAASGHDAEGRVIEGKRFVYPEMAAAGLWTTPTDLARLAIEVQLAIEGKSNKVLSRDVARLMVTPQLKIAPGMDMALGFFLEKGDGYFGHGGQDVGFICQLVASVKDGCGAVVMTNTDGRSVPLIGEILNAIALTYGWKGYVPEPVEVVKLGPDALKGFEGRFRLSSDDTLTVKLDGGRLMGKDIDPTSSFELLPVAPNEFVRRDQDLRYLFAPGGPLTIRSPRREIKAERMETGAKVPLECLLEQQYVDAAVLYRQVHTANAKDPAVEEGRLNGLAYLLMQKGKIDAALVLFRLNVEFYPDSWNAYDSLGEGYMTKGEDDLAIKYYEKSLELNPKNVNGAKTLEKLKKKRTDSSAPTAFSGVAGLCLAQYAGDYSFDGASL